MKTKIDYVFKGIGVTFKLPVDPDKNPVQGYLEVEGDIEMHVETEGNWIDSLFSFFAVNKIVSLIKQLSK